MDYYEDMKNQQAGTIAVIVLIIAAVIVVAGGGAYYYFSSRAPSADEQIFCTQEAKQCPDGSYVSRTGPQCAFDPCPGSMATSASQIPDDWKTYRNEKYGFEIKYPSNLTEVSEEGEKISFNDPLACKKPSDYDGEYCFSKLVSVEITQSLLDAETYVVEKFPRWRKFSETTIAGARAVVAGPVDTEGFGTLYVVSKNGKIFSILIYAGIRDDAQSILNSFKTLL